MLARCPLPSLPVLALAASLTGQHVVFAEGASPASLTLLRLDETAPAAGATPVRTGLELLPIEITMRTAQLALDATRARMVERRGLRRVELPGGGRLFRYRAGGGATWGFLLVEADGGVQFLFERPGAGAGGLDDPFADRIGVSPDGAWAVAATALGAIEIARLDGGTFASSGKAWRPVALPAAVEPLSLCPGASMLFCTTADGRLWRTPMADGGVPTDLTPAPAGLDFKDELALAGDGKSIAFLYGPKPTWHIYLAGENGAARQLPPPAAKYEEPGYLPETAGGPRLMLNQDGTRLLYVDATIRDETFWLDTTGATPTTHVTGDPNFQPYIGIVVFPVAIAGVVTLGVGDPGRFDVYAASTASPAVVNLTHTAGNLTAPFGAGGVVPGNLTAAADGSLLAELDVGGRAELWRLTAAGNRVLATGLASALTRAPGEGPRPDYVVSTAAGDVLVSGIDGNVVLAAPPGVTLSNPVAPPSGLFRLLDVGAGGQRGVAFLFPGGGSLGLPATPALREASWTGRGLVIDDGDLAYFDRGGRHVVAGAVAERWVLSGLGTGR